MDFDDHPASSTIHALCIGNGGGGKTGALASLAAAGYNLRILDFDGGTEIIAGVLKDNPAARKRIDVETFVDKYAPQQGTGALRPVPNCNAFEMSMKCLESWPKYGSPLKWTPREVLVIDSLTMMGKAAMNHVAKMKGKLVSIKPVDLHPSQPDWGDAMGLQENLLAMLMGLPCQVIVNAHVVFLTADGEVADQGFPSALGSKLPPKVGTYFNSQLYFTKDGVGDNKRRIIKTKSSSLVETKTPAPDKVADSYPIQTGLADYFKAILGPLKAEEKINAQA